MKMNTNYSRAAKVSVVECPTHEGTHKGAQNNTNQENRERFFHDERKIFRKQIICSELSTNCAQIETEIYISDSSLQDWCVLAFQRGYAHEKVHGIESRMDLK